MNSKYFEKYSKRLNRMSLIIVLFAFILLSGFIYIQVPKHPDLENKILKDGFREKIIIGDRGKIVDCNGKELATTINKYSLI